MNTRAIDLNADLGEGYPNDAALLARVTSASVACGAHAGDPKTILGTLRDAKPHGVIVGAHPGYADRAGFGRREQSLPAAEVERLIVEQVMYLDNIATEAGLPIRFVKPHGALYNQAQRQDEVAEGVVAALSRLMLPLLGQPVSVLEARARDKGVRYITEGFPDRRYRADGRLVPRSEPNAILDDPAEIEAQVVRLVDQGVMTLCIHGDDPRAVANAETIRAILRRHEIALHSFV
jgi:5-oxoprolinase (ATP-hydrolysing) subunit A